MSTVVPILEQQLAEAVAQGDLPHQIALAIALLKERGVDVARLQALIVMAARGLIARHDPSDLEAAAAWAQTWLKQSRGAEARDVLAALQPRIAAVKQNEDDLRAALAAGEQSALRAALAPFSDHPDRLTGSEALLTQAREELARLLTQAKHQLSDRVAKSDLLRRRLLAEVPHALDRAVAVHAQLTALDPTAVDDPELADLTARFAVVAERERVVEAALAATPIAGLADALVTLAAATDAVSGSPALRQRVEVELARRRERAAQLTSEVAAVDHQRPDRLVPLLTELAALIPDAPEVAGLIAIRQELDRLRELHRAVEAGIRDPQRSGFRPDLERLRASTTSLDDSMALIARADAALASQRAEVERRQRLIRRVAMVAGPILALVVMLWIRDASAHNAITVAASPDEGLRLAEGYIAGGGHLFYRDAARADAARLAAAIGAREFAAAQSATDVAERIARLDAYLKRPDPREAAAARELLRSSRLEMEDRAYAIANAIPDLDQRLAALAAYAARTTVPARADQAVRTANDLRRARDEKMWADVLAAGDANGRLARLDAYLRLATPLLHSEEAGRLRTDANLALDRRRAETLDDTAWNAALAHTDGADVIAALDAYLAGTTLKAHADQARTRREQQVLAVDDRAWHDAVMAEALSVRAERLRVYLAGGAGRRHQAEAEQALAETVWALASVADQTAPRLERVRAYLADAAHQAHRADAERLARDLTTALDREAWDKARAPTDPAERLRALAAYISAPGSHAFILAAGEEQARAVEELAKTSSVELAKQSPALLARLPPEQLVALPSDVLARLPATVQARLPLKPAWAGSAGVDAYGRWSALTIGKQTLRFRFLVAGRCSVNTNDGAAQVALERACWMADRECPQRVWVEVLGGFFSDHNPSQHRGSELPVDSVSLDACHEFLTAANQRLEKETVPARLRLPTAVEWRYAAATGSDGAIAIERGLAGSYVERDLIALAWSKEVSDGHPRTVDDGQPDRWGICDLLGNLGEWCEGELDGSPHWRGGTWKDMRSECHPDRAVPAKADAESETVGFRLVVEDK